jgi:hypothetical protein
MSASIAAGAEASRAGSPLAWRGKINSALAMLAFAAGLGLAASPARAEAVTLTFATLPNAVTIGSYFNGGLSGFPASGTGPSDGLVFSANANEQKDTVGRTTGTGKFENNPSGLNGVLYFPFSSTTGSFINDASGFSGLSFAYSLLNNLASEDTTVDIWSGLNGTGTLLETLSLTAASTTVACTANVHPVDEFCTWSTAAAGGFGIAESVSFGSNNSADLVEFDELTFVPEPGSAAMLLAGVGMLGVQLKRRSAARPA